MLKFRVATKKTLMSASKTILSPCMANARSRRRRKRRTTVVSSGNTEASSGHFTLPSSVDLAQVSARYAQGVLKINLAKKAEAKPKWIFRRSLQWLRDNLSRWNQHS